MKRKLQTGFVIIVLLYLCFSGWSAILKLGYTFYGTSYYSSMKSPAHLIDNAGKLVSSSDYPAAKKTGNNGSLVNDSGLRKYDSVGIATYRLTDEFVTSGEAYYKWLALALALFCTILIITKTRIVECCAKRFDSRITVIRLLDGTLVAIVIVLAYMKTGIIDMTAFGYAVNGLDFGINYYAHGILTNNEGRLPLFPYNPPSILILQLISIVQSHLEAVALSAHSYSLVSVVFIICYLWTSHELAVYLTREGITRISQRKLFYFIFLNPLGIYYVFFLGQMDVIALSLIVAGAIRIFGSCNQNIGAASLTLGLVFAKPQHLIVIPALIYCFICLRSRSDVISCGVRIVLVVLGALTISWCYSYIPSFSESLSGNPQAQRLSWSTWWTLLSDAIVINRPIGLLIIANIILLLITPKGLLKSKIPLIFFLGMATCVAIFQFSYAHTFGFSIFLFPAAIIACLLLDHPMKSWFVYFYSFSLVLTWGTGLVGDFTNLWGANLFLSPQIINIKVMGISYASVLNTVEYTSYLMFFLIFIFAIRGMRDSHLPRPDNPA